MTPATSNGVQQSASDVSGNDGSKFKRFLKRFGRHPSDDAHVQTSDSAHTSKEAGFGTQNGIEVANDGGKRFGSHRQRKESKPKNSASSTKAKRGDATLAGRFFQQPNNPPALPRGNSAAQQSIASTPGAEKTVKAAFNDHTNVGGLANTLTLPSGQTSPPPQLSGLPHHDPIATSDLLRVSGTSSPPSTALQLPESTLTEGGQDHQANDSKVFNALPAPDHYNDVKVVGDQITNHTSQAEIDQHATHALSPQSSYGSSRSARVRDSVDNRTTDTNKSRASTKPTTLMSLDTRENVQGNAYAPLAQIAQHRMGDQSHSNSYFRSNPGRNTSDSSAMTSAAPNQNQSAIQFASAPATGRTASGTIVQLPGQYEAPEEEPYTNVPTMSRPHPGNNPHPAGVPADNASMLTLASSTAAMSIAGGAASSRGHSHAAPSFGGARSIGGSLMGERRNSSDTYASVKALPPLSRRGSDASARTGMSVAASATGLNSAQAMLAHVAPSATSTAPGAPGDRISIHRTPSQRTVATQLSIPLSTSTHALAGVHPDGVRAATPDSTPALSALLAAPPTAPSASLAASLPLATDPVASRNTNDPHSNADPSATEASVAVPSILTSQVSTDSLDHRPPTGDIEYAANVAA